MGATKKKPRCGGMLDILVLKQLAIIFQSSSHFYSLALHLLLKFARLL